MMNHEGQILHELLKERKIGVTEVAKKFEITRRAVYNYFDSDTLSNKVKRRFLESFNVDIGQAIHDARYPTPNETSTLDEPEREYLQKRNETLQKEVQEYLKQIGELQAAGSEKDKRIAALEDMLKVALERNKK